MIFIYLLMALIGAAAVVFAVQNPTPVAVSFLIWQSGGLPLSLVILLSAVAGVVLASVAGLAQQIRLRLRIRQLEARVAQLSAPVAAPPLPPAARPPGAGSPPAHDPPRTGPDVGRPPRTPGERGPLR